MSPTATPAAPTNIREQLIRDEGKRARPYQDTQGVWSVGVGHNLTKGPPLSDAAMEQILRDDIAGVESACTGLPIWRQLSPARRGVIINLAFDLGFAGLLSFQQMLSAMEASDWERAAKELLDSRYAKQVGARADRLAKQLLDDRWV